MSQEIYATVFSYCNELVQTIGENHCWTVYIIICNVMRFRVLISLCCMVGKTVGLLVSIVFDLGLPRPHIALNGKAAAAAIEQGMCPVVDLSVDVFAVMSNDGMM